MNKWNRREFLMRATMAPALCGAQGEVSYAGEYPDMLVRYLAGKTNALAARPDDVAADLIDQRHIGAQPLSDDSVDLGHVGRRHVEAVALNGAGVGHCAVPGQPVIIESRPFGAVSPR